MFLDSLLIFAVGAETLAIMALASGIAGAATSAYGMIEQGRATKRQANYDAKVQENNAVAEGYAAIQEQQAAARDVEQLREERLRNLGSQRASAAHSGLTISGSVLDTMGDSAIASETDIQMTLYRGRMGAYNTGQRSANLLTQASMTRTAGRNAARSANLSAGGTLLGGVSNAAGGYASFRRAGGK